MHPESPSMPLILDKVAKFYGPKLVFKDVSLCLHAGTMLLVAGPNGAGKSTLLKVMAGLLQPDAGKRSLNLGREKIGFLGHHTFLYPELSGLENLRFWAGLYGLGAADKDLMAVLERMELSAAAAEPAGRYSRGMAQRLSLARVLLLTPSLILLDEPATGLDQRSSQALFREMRAAKERGASLVWVSHHLERDLAMADQVLSLKGRRQDFLGSAADYATRLRAEAQPC